MAMNWNNGLCKFDLSYWVIRGDIPHLESVDGTIQFELSCKELESGEKQKSYKEICKMVEEKCPRLISNLAKTQGLSYDELIDIFIHSIEDNNVNADTIETDDERKIRLDHVLNANKNFFDKYSQNVYE